MVGMAGGGLLGGWQGVPVERPSVCATQGSHDGVRVNEPDDCLGLGCRGCHWDCDLAVAQNKKQKSEVSEVSRQKCIDTSLKRIRVKEVRGFGIRLSTAHLFFI